ncbi:MAG: STAS domain-containing protein, partial [Acidobacteriaceae bacterium]
MPLRLNSRFCGNVYIIGCSGRIVAGEELRCMESELDLAVRDFSRVVLQIAEVDRLDSTGMGLLVRYAATTRKRGGDVRLASSPPFIEHLLNMTRLSSILQVYPTEEDAVLSFLKEHPPQTTRPQHGLRVLMVDESANVCAFVRTVLVEHGYDVRSTSSFRDARTLLQAEEVDYILVGPGNPQLSPETIMGSLKKLAPKAAAFHLGADYRSRNA